ncbi:ArsR/SmtB family transcription factor [Alkalicoccus halolimnae]|uniref:Metalloregulator ArsR/SmtB family transcription factor n=1 Tax=Alkalicoccus halolimnae TaxID=1667239 RepID=A0A5C7F461_9BACI|nr:metalloregulator ArsR/SmtB family transcription factor [Alkalicoccus halolimnae]TXF85392.1 winged helix-turn-helix transcriptional regulator [Alkalicoccus halolimnae]
MNKTVEHAIPMYADLFKMISDKNRLKILLYLKEDEFCVCELGSLLHISQPAVSQNLKKLREASIIKSRKHDQWHFYSLNEEYKQIDMLQSVLEQLPSAADEIKRMNEQGERVLCTVIDVKNPENTASEIKTEN